jgi:hypothetical protein
LSFHSQETPPDATWTEPPRGKPENFISLETLLKVGEKQNAITLKKKERKWKNKKETGNRSKLRTGHQDTRVLITSCILWMHGW